MKIDPPWNKITSKLVGGERGDKYGRLGNNKKFKKA